tara:strand:+ start:646 stop:852 length:207 start_codon:yes stop_codon:yes gene_type:complete
MTTNRVATKQPTKRDNRLYVRARTLAMAFLHMLHVGLPDLRTHFNRQAACTTAWHVHWHVSLVGSWQT